MYNDTRTHINIHIFFFHLTVIDTILMYITTNLFVPYIRLLLALNSDKVAAGEIASHTSAFGSLGEPNFL